MRNIAFECAINDSLYLFLIIFRSLGTSLLCLNILTRTPYLVK